MSQWFTLLNGEKLICSDCGRTLKHKDDVYVDTDSHITEFRCKVCQDKIEPTQKVCDRLCTCGHGLCDHDYNIYVCDVDGCICEIYNKPKGAI